MSNKLEGIDMPNQFIASTDYFRKLCSLSKSSRVLSAEIARRTSWNNLYFELTGHYRQIKELLDNEIIFKTDTKNKYKINNSLFHCYDTAQYFDEDGNMYVRALDENEKEILILIDESLLK